MRRRVFTFCSALSLLLSVTVCVHWPFSFWYRQGAALERWREPPGAAARVTFVKIGTGSGCLSAGGGWYAVLDTRKLAEAKNSRDRDLPVRLGPLRVGNQRVVMVPPWLALG